jgi:hypothetical protein
VPFVIEETNEDSSSLTQSVLVLILHATLPDLNSLIKKKSLGAPINSMRPSSVSFLVDAVMVVNSGVGSSVSITAASEPI